MSKDDFKNSVLVEAATNKNPDVFEAVLSGVEKGLTPQEVPDSAALKLSAPPNRYHVQMVRRRP